MQKLYAFIDRVWQWISNKVFVRFEFEMAQAPLREIQENGKLVFALTHGGFVEWLILSSWCRKHGFGAILVANRKFILCFAKPLYFLQIVFRRKSYADLILGPQDGPRIVFFPAGERKKLSQPTESELLLGELLTKSAATTLLTDVTFVPVFICWRKHLRGASRQLGEFLFGLSSNPNLIGKVWYLARRRMDSQVRALAPIPLHDKEIPDSVDGFEDSEILRRARGTRRRITVAVNQEMRVVLGPRYFSPDSVKETLMRDPEIQAAIEQTAQEQGIDKKKVMATAYQYLTEIAAKHRFRFVEVMFVFLSWLFTKVFDGLVSRKEDLQMVRDTMKAKPVVFVSCHRSHLDYLVVPYLMFANDLVTPYIAAGINLSFWPVGPFIRSGGAFFIRRSFRGNKLYSTCLKKYVEFLIRSRVNVKFFIEGTRSRTGKMLPPAFGFLKMVLETYHAGAVEDVALIPVSICYDEVLEEGSYTRELSGGAKEKESASGLIKSRKLVKRNIGKVYVRFAAPFHTKEIEQTAVAQGMDRTLMLQKTAFQLCKSINDVTPVTPKSVVCTTLLTHETESLSLEQILRATDYLTEYVTWSGKDLSVPVGVGFKRAVEQTLRALQKNNSVVTQTSPPLRYEVVDKRRTALNFYKNNAIHCLVTPAIAMLAYLETAQNRSQDFVADWLREALAIRNLLKFEFFFNPTHLFADEVKATFAHLLGFPTLDGLTQEKAQIALKRRFPHLEDISIYTRLLGDLVESYRITGETLQEHSGTETDQKLLVQKILKYGQGRFEAGELYFPESLSTQNFSQAIKFYENTGWVSLKKEADKTSVKVSEIPPEAAAALEKMPQLLSLMEQPLRSILS